MPPIKTFRIPLSVTIIAIIASFILGGPEVGLIVVLLTILEISISFDNAIVNAHILKRMNEKWQQIFLTWGILIAVFGMRLVFPIVIVAAAAGLSIPDVLDQAFNEQELYAQNLEEANATIAAFGGMFLLMVFLNFFFDSDKEGHWLPPIERPIAGVGSITSITPAIASAALLVLATFVSPEMKEDVLYAGLAGLVVYLVVSGVAERLEPDDDEDEEEEEAAAAAPPTDYGTGPSGAQAAAAAAAATAKGGLAYFLYLEVLDATFSFDGVIGAFAVSKDIIVIAVGLGLGALYIRTLTVYLVRQGTLAKYRYLEHGAHYAIGVLAVLLFISAEVHVPEVITGTIGALLILAAFFSSIRANRAEEGDPPDSGTHDREVAQV
jgi:uncharacterized protein